MDAMLFLMRETGISAQDVESVTLHAGSNVLGPIRYRIAKTELEGKFSFAFLLSAIVLAGKAGKAEFTDEFVSSAACQDMQARIETRFSPEIEAMGWDRIRSKIEVVTKDGRTFERWADENYRGSPHNPLSDEELADKFRNCAEGLLSEPQMTKVLDLVWALDAQTDVGQIFDLLAYHPQ